MKTDDGAWSLSATEAAGARERPDAYGLRGMVASAHPAAAAVGIIGGVIGAMGAAAAADAGPVYGPVPVYGGCYWVRRPVYDDWGNYLGRRRMRVCD